jgi:hypothetical protein
MSHLPHPKNVPGDFYVEDGCCMACQVALGEAPDLVGWDGKHCFVKKQPRTEEEFNSMVDAIAVTEADCFRYRGTDAGMLQRLVTLGDAGICDHPVARYLRPIIRPYARFRPAEPGEDSDSLVAALGSYLVDQNSSRGRAPYELKPRGPVTPVGRLEFRWYGEEYHRVDFQADPINHRLFVVRLTPKTPELWPVLARIVHGWLSRYASAIGWLTEAEFERGDRGAHLPL